MAAIDRINSDGQVVEGILIRPDGKGVFLLEVVLDEDRTLNSRVTKHPVEDGSQISDHIILENKTFKSTVVISDASFVTGDSATRDVGLKIPSLGVIDLILNKLGFVEQFFDNAIDRKPVVTTEPSRSAALAARADLESIRDNKEVLTLKTSIGEYSNIVITGIRTNRNSTKSNRTFEFTLSMEQVQIVDRAASITFVKKKPDVKDEASSLKESGKQGTKDISVLTEIIDSFIGGK